MTRFDLQARLRRHGAHNAHEGAMRDRILEFIGAHADCFERSLLEGHVTASAWIVGLEREHALLTHHAKLDLWLQMGGHCDGDADVLRVARREVEEESGLTRLAELLDGAIFDADAHAIPARGHEPAHVHYDIRFAFEADRTVPLRISVESKELRWVRLDAVRALNTDESVLRMVEKSRALPRREAAA